MKQFILLVFLLGHFSAFASHPQLLMDSTEAAFIQSKVTANTADWQALKAQCDSIKSLPVNYVSYTGRQGDYINRPMQSGTHGSRDIGNGDYYGAMYNADLFALAACYQALNAVYPKTAAGYLAQGINIMTALAQPPLVLRRQSDGLVTTGSSVDTNGHDLLAGARMTVYGNHTPAYSVGDTLTISGARGCTSLNGTFKISSISSRNYYFANTDGSAAPTINAKCTLYSYNPNGDSGYGARFYVPALAFGYDWLYSGLSTQQREDAIATMNEYLQEVGRIGYGQDASEQNYFSGYFWGLVAAYVATDDGNNASMTTWYTNKLSSLFTASNMLRDYHNRWLSGGGYGEGLQAYGYSSIRAVANATMAMKLHGTDWTQAPYNFPFIDDEAQYFMGFTTPTLLALDDNEYVYPMGTTEAGITEPTYIPLGHAAFLGWAANRSGSSSCAAKFQSWYRAVYSALKAAAGTVVPAWNTGVYKSQPTPVDAFLYYNSSAPSSDWTTSPLLYRGWGGNYAVTRSDHTTNAVEVTLLGGPSVGVAGNGKTQFNSGAITIQRGNNRLVVYGLGEAARAYDIINSTQFNILHNERSIYGNKKNSIFWAGPNTSETRNQGLTSRVPPPGHVITTTTWGSSIDRASDSTDYTYIRASGLEANNATSAIDGQYHQNAWTREVFFLRPKLVVVHDRTTVRNTTDDRAIFWTFGRNIAQVSAPVGMMRYDASFNSIYRGAFTSVLPANASVSVVDHDNLHFLYRAEVRPSALDHVSDNWLAVLDAADSPGNVNAIAKLNAINADVVQFNDANNSVIAFPQASTPTFPITYQFSGTARHYVTGLSPSVTYNVNITGNTFTIAASGSGIAVVADMAGVLAY